MAHFNDTNGFFFVTQILWQSKIILNLISGSLENFFKTSRSSASPFYTLKIHAFFKGILRGENRSHASTFLDSTFETAHFDDTNGFLFANHILWDSEIILNSISGSLENFFRTSKSSASTFYTLKIHVFFKGILRGENRSHASTFFDSTI